MGAKLYDPAMTTDDLWSIIDSLDEENKKLREENDFLKNGKPHNPFIFKEVVASEEISGAEITPILLPHTEDEDDSIPECYRKAKREMLASMGNSGSELDAVLNEEFGDDEERRQARLRDEEWNRRYGKQSFWDRIQAWLRRRRRT